VTAAHGWVIQQSNRNQEIKMAEHKPGSMDIRTQEQTFAGFVSFVKWSVVIIIGVLIFMALVNA
jgi:hypothetical protein